MFGLENKRAAAWLILLISKKQSKEGGDHLQTELVTVSTYGECNLAKADIHIISDKSYISS